MICLRSGYCCKTLAVIVVKDPEKGLVEDNLVLADRPCQHLRGDKLGEYRCNIHHYDWYKNTPCFQHGQIEKSAKDQCRMGKYILVKKTI